MTPFTPYVCEELWETLGKKDFISNAQYPKADETKVDREVEAQEEMIRNLIEDIQNILKATGKTPKRIHLYVAPEWKRTVYEAIASGRTMKDVMSEPAMKPYGKEIAKLMQKRREEIPDVILSAGEEYKVFEEARDFLAREFSCNISVEKKPPTGGEEKAKHALPGKPGVYLE
jgi:leucyl-tRNA synthetase